MPRRTSACMMPPFTSPFRTAASIDPARRTALIARMCSAWPPSTPSPELDIPHVVHRHRVPAQQRTDVAVLDEPHHVFARPGVNQRGAHDPYDPPAPLLLLAEQFGENRVVHRPLARHLGLHEPELVGAVPSAEK